jgi:hypothetical protein
MKKYTQLGGRKHGKNPSGPCYIHLSLSVYNIGAILADQEKPSTGNEHSLNPTYLHTFQSKRVIGLYEIK